METHRRNRFNAKHLFKTSKIKKKKNKCKSSRKKWNKIASNFKTVPVATEHSKDFQGRPSSSSSLESSSQGSEVYRSNQNVDPKFWSTERSYQTEATTSNAYAGIESHSRRAIRPREETESSDDSNNYEENQSGSQDYYRSTSLDKRNLEQAVKAQIIKEKLGDGVGAFSDVFSMQSEDENEDSSDEEQRQILNLRSREKVNQQQYERPETPDTVERISEEEAEPMLDENDFQILKDRNFCILILGKNAEAALVGMAMVKVVSGQVQILGFTLNPNAKNFVPVYSLKLQSHLIVRALPASNVPKRQMKENLIKKLENELVSGRIINYIAETTDQNSTIVLFKHVASKVSVKYAFHLSSLNFGSVQLGESIKLNHMSYKKLVNANYSIVPIADVKHLKMEKINGILSEIESNLGYYISHGTPPPRVLLCGPKNAGKSTILRYLMNFILPICPKIIYLDADPGQSEFTSCGTVSLTTVDSPLLGPPFTHQKTPEAMVYVGGKTVINTPDTYSTGVWDLMVHYHKFFPHLPLFINTMGWTNTPGRNLLLDVMRYAEPTFVIQLNLDHPSSQNLPNLTPSFVNEELGWKTNPGDCNLGYELRIWSLNSEEFPHIAAHPGVTSKIFRELAFYAYFGRLQAKASADNYDPINSFKPYKIAFNSVGVYFCNETPPYEFVLDALNATLVALCHIDKDQFIQDAKFPHYPKRVTSMEGNVQLGFGIIRGINRDEETLLIVTPEPLERLQSVNALVLGYDEFPTKLLTSQKVQGFIPYVSKRDDQSSALSQKAKRKRIKSAIDSQEWKSPILV